MYKRCDNVEKSCDATIKAAKAVSDEDVDQAIIYYLDAIEQYVSEEKHIFVGDTWRTCLNLMVRNRKLDEAVKLLEKMFSVFEKLEQADYLHKAQLSVVVIKLSKGDVGGAAKSCDSYGDFAMEEEGCAARELLDAFEAGDVDAIKTLTAKQIFTLLENQVARLAARLKDVCTEQEEDLTGARESSAGRGGRSAAGAKVFQLSELDDSLPSAKGGGGGGGGGAKAAAKAADPDELDELC